MHTTPRATVIALVALAAGACTDSPTAPAEVGPVWQLEQMAANAYAAGDMQGGGRLAVVANAMRHGVRPSRYEAFTGGRVEAYLALVLVEEHQGVEPGMHTRFDRFFYLWHEAESPAAFHLLRMKTTGEYGWMEPNAGDPGVAVYSETPEIGAASHLGAYAGMGRIMEVELGGPCENTGLMQASHRVACNKGLFRVAFELDFTGEDATGVTTHLDLRARPQYVRGIKWTLNDPE